MKPRVKGRGLVRVFGWLLLMASALAIVAWRQTEGLAREQALRELQSERAIVQAERVDLERRIQSLTARARIVRVARERLGMHLPSDRELVFLPDTQAVAEANTPAGMDR